MILYSVKPDSAFGEKMVNDDYEQVVNIDISSVVIRAMQSKYSHLPHLQCNISFEFCLIPFHSIALLILNDHSCTDMKMDVRDMSAFEDNSFDAVIDKGTK